MHPLLQRLVTGSRFAGLEAEIMPGGMRFHLVVLKRKGQQMAVEKTATNIESIEQLPALLSKEIPLAIAVTGKGLLHRRVAVDPSSDLRTLLAKALPNATLKDFYVQHVPAAQDEQFISVMRKPAIDTLLLQFQQLEMPVISCSLGPLAVTHALPLLEEKNELHLGHHLLRFEAQQPSEVQHAEEACGNSTFDVGGQQLEGEAMVAFAAAFLQVLPGISPVAANVDSLDASREDHLQQRLFRAGGKALLATTLLLLLGNYAAFSFYWSTKGNLEQQLQVNGGAYTELNLLERQVSSKRLFLQQAGLLGSSHHAYYSDQLAAGLPAEIRLARMTLSPRLNLSGEDSIGFTPHTIAIAGSCSESVVLNRWLRGLNETKWIKSAALLSYVQDKTMPQGEFEVLLALEQ